MEKTEHLESLTLDAIKEIQAYKQNNGIAPDYATKAEIDKLFSDAILTSLRNLYRNGLIEHHKSVNGASMFGVAD